MALKSIIRMGELLAVIGILLAVFLLYQARECPNPECLLMFAYFSALMMLIALIVFIVTSFFVIRLWMKRKSFKYNLPKDYYGQIKRVKKDRRSHKAGHR